MRALAVEDDPRIARDLKAALEAAGFAVQVTGDGEEAWFLGDVEDFDLIVLDLGLPRMDGLAVLKRWRAGGRQMPVLVLTARGAWTERVEGIDAGADDYLPKPFHMEELVARARSLVRRSAGLGSAAQTVGELTIDANRMTVARRGVPVSLSPLEYRLIAYLALRREQVVSPSELLEHLYGDDDAREANALEALVTRLRRKVGPGVVGTRRGFGYFLEGADGVIWSSLRLRLVLAGGAAVLVSLTIAAIGLALLFERHVERRAVAELSADLDQLAAGLERDAAGALEVAAPPADQRYQQPLSGRYWEILTPDGALISRSLWDTPLALPPETGASGALRQYRLMGPENEALLVIERRLLLPERAGGTTVRAAVAMDRAELRVASRDFLRDLIPYIGLLAATLIAAGWWQVAVGLKPLKAVGARVAAVRSGSAARLGADFPDEVRPLAAEVDELIAAREADIAGARARAADLAHGLKTPLQALFGEARLLADRGERDAAEGIEEIVTAMRRHVDRELSRARIAAAGRTAVCDAGVVVERVLRVLRRTPSGGGILWRARGLDAVWLRIEADDLTEALGAVLENAGAHARSTVEVTAASEGGMTEIRIRDDGPGVEELRLAELTIRGIRLDARGPGAAGLGLAIASEICAAAGGALNLRNTGSGFEVALRLRAAPEPPPDAFRLTPAG